MNLSSNFQSAADIDMRLRLLKVPILPLFVFDGPERPVFKRNKEVRIMENTQLNELRELIAAFGFECITVSGFLQTGHALVIEFLARHLVKRRQHWPS